GQAQKLGAVDEQFLGRDVVTDLQIVAETIGLGLEDREALDVGLLVAGVGATGGEGHGDVVARRLGRLFDADRAAQNDLFGNGATIARVGLDLLIGRKNRRQLARLVDVPVLLGRQPQASAIGAAAVIGPAIGRRRRPGSS